MSLPIRLEGLLARNYERQRTNRRILIPVLQGDAGFRTRWSTSETNGVFDQLLSFFDVPHSDLAATRSSKSKLLNDLRVLDTARINCVFELCTAHLASGFEIALSDRKGERAAADFNIALTFDPKDLDALELAAREAYAAGTNNRVALKHLRELALAASDAHDVVRHARALRFQAEMFLDRPVGAAWDGARTTLNAAISALQGQLVDDKSAKELELALAFELLAFVQVKRERLNAARLALNSARVHFHNSFSRPRRRGIRRLKKFERDLVQAEKDRDNPGVTD